MFKKNKKKKTKDLNKYYWKVPQIKQTILNQVRKNQSTIYGARALNAHLPPHLRKHTEDYDIYSDNPKKSAKQLEKALDKKFGGDFFRVEKAKYKRTVKVKSNVTDKTVADFTKPKGKIPKETTWDGINYARLQHLKEKLKGIVKDKSKEFRWKKDKEALQRIKIREEL